MRIKYFKELKRELKRHFQFEAKATIWTEKKLSEEKTTLMKKILSVLL